MNNVFAVKELETPGYLKKLKRMYVTYENYAMWKRQDSRYRRYEEEEILRYCKSTGFHRHTVKSMHIVNNN